ncbi:MAG: glycosyltransferase [Chromatiales bacterium]|nr:glycosyltransferase [Chromatiales bacterium]
MRSDTAPSPPGFRVLFWGTYDRGRPRNRISIEGLRRQGAAVTLLHADVWAGIEDKSRIHGWLPRLRQATRLAAAYLRLTVGYLFAPRHEVVVVAYLGFVDIFLLWPWAMLRRKPIVWDAMMSLYNTLVIDRELVKPGSLPARILFAAEWLACRMAKRVLVTTEQRRGDFVARYGLRAERVCVIPLGAEYAAFPERPATDTETALSSPIELLFYGQFTPLHGVETLIRAARLAADRPYHWTIIGNGQTAEQVRAMLDATPLPSLQWIDWVDYPQLAHWIHRADIGLGIFGTSAKSAETIPNKIYQILATGTPLITRDSPAIRELLPDGGAPGVYLVPPADPEALLQAIERFATERVGFRGVSLHQALNEKIRDDVSGRRLMTVLQDAAATGQKQ